MGSPAPLVMRAVILTGTPANGGTSYTELSFPPHPLEPVIQPGPALTGF